MTGPAAWTPEQRFWAKVDRRGPDECWPWTASNDGEGYGQLILPGRQRWRAPRYAYELAHGPIPSGMQIDHLCLNKACVNPAHLEVVTPGENTRRYHASRPTCVRGHPRTEQSTYLYARRNGRGVERVCKPCVNARSVVRRATGSRAKPATTAGAGPEKGARFVSGARVGTSDLAAAAAATT